MYIPLLLLLHGSLFRVPEHINDHHRASFKEIGSFLLSQKPRLTILKSLIRSQINDDIIFTTGSESIKAKYIHRNKLVSICIDDQIPPFSFITIFGTAKIFPIYNKTDSC
jgi:hypothetical protein